MHGNKATEQTMTTTNVHSRSRINPIGPILAATGGWRFAVRDCDVAKYWPYAYIRCVYVYNSIILPLLICARMLSVFPLPAVVVVLYDCTHRYSPQPNVAHDNRLYSYRRRSNARGTQLMESNNKIYK